MPGPRLPRDPRRWPFTSVGAATLALFLLVQVLFPAGPEGPVSGALYALLRVAIAPIWFMRYVVLAVATLLGLSLQGGLPLWYELVTVPALLIPYIAFDLLLQAVRTPLPGSHAARAAGSEGSLRESMPEAVDMNEG